MKHWLVLGIGLLLTSCSLVQSNTGLDEDTGSAMSDVSAVEVTLENLGPAPELENEVWLNVDKPLRLSNLRGSVVLIDMWTFG
jgi:hypothetical protein